MNTEPRQTLDSDGPLVVAWFTVLFVLAIGVANGGSDQSVYLLQGIARANPDFLAGDWFTWDTAPAHEAFGLLVALLSRLGILEIGLTLGAVLQSAVVALSLYWGIRAVHDRPLVPWALAALLLAAVGTRGIGLSRLINPHMQASAIGGVCLLTGLVLLAWDKRLRAGLALGIGGLFHAHFALLTLAVLLPLTVVESRPRRPFVVAVLLPFLALSSYNLLQATLYALSPASAQSTAIALARFPHHLLPSSWSPASYAVFLSAILVGFGGWIARRPRPKPRLAWSLVFIFLIVVSSVVIGYLRVLDSVNLAFPWRLSTLVVLACIALGSASLCAPEAFRLRTPLLVPAATVAGLALVVAASRVLPARVVAAAVTAMLVPASILISRRLSTSGGAATWTSRLPLVVITIGFIPAVVHGLELSHVDFRPDHSARNDLYAWVRTTAPKGEVFAVPPSWKEFRLVAERPILVDHKATPLNSRPDLVAWFDRLYDLTGIPPANNVEELDEAFFSLDCDRAAALRSRYGLRFVVRPADRELPCGTAVYEDGRYSVFDLAP